jgi:hypothetical protein
VSPAHERQRCARAVIARASGCSLTSRARLACDSSSRLRARASSLLVSCGPGALTRTLSAAFADPPACRRGVLPSAHSRARSHALPTLLPTRDTPAPAPPRVVAPVLARVHGFHVHAGHRARTRTRVSAPAIRLRPRARARPRVRARAQARDRAAFLVRAHGHIRRRAGTSSRVARSRRSWKKTRATYCTFTTVSSSQATRGPPNRTITL